MGSLGVLGRALELYRELDVVGVNAYFHPFSQQRYPIEQEVLSRWGQVRTQVLSPLAHELGRPIIFTEAGSASTPYALYQLIPEMTTEVDLDAQLLYYKGLVKTLWEDQWFFGVFWWDYGLTATAGFEPTSGGVWDWQQLPDSNRLRATWSRSTWGLLSMQAPCD